MIETKYKSAEEIRYSVGKAESIAILSCGACANLCDVGGVRGMEFIRKLLEEWGKRVVAARTIIACCPEPIMKQAQRRVLRSSKVDALIVISCAAGVKSAFLSEPGVPVIAACDSVGAGPVTPKDECIDDLVAHTLCSSCGHCVLSYTVGICPVAACRAKSCYGPCSKAPEEGTQCALDPTSDCVWKEIERRGANLAVLQELKRIHEANKKARLPSLSAKASPTYIKRFVGNMGVSFPGRLLEMVHWIR